MGGMPRANPFSASFVVLPLEFRARSGTVSCDLQDYDCDTPLQRDTLSGGNLSCNTLPHMPFLLCDEEIWIAATAWVWPRPIKLAILRV